MKIKHLLQCFPCVNSLNPQGEGGLIFGGSTENVTKNGETLLLERISLFDGKTNPIRCFSISELNSMNVKQKWSLAFSAADGQWHEGVWIGKPVMVKTAGCARWRGVSREIAVATQMSTHKNVHKLVGCCLETNWPVIVYERPENGTLEDRLMRYKEQNKQPLEWKDRLRIAWEISHAVAYLHSAFRRTIIHRNLTPFNVFLDQDDAAKLGNFRWSISLPDGKKRVEDVALGPWGYAAPESLSSGVVAESSDVFSYGILFLVLLTGKEPGFNSRSDSTALQQWVLAAVATHNVSDVLDPAMTTNGPITDENILRQIRASINLALRCTTEEEESRPTMEDVAVELKNMLTPLCESIPSAC